MFQFELFLTLDDWLLLKMKTNTNNNLFLAKACTHMLAPTILKHYLSQTGGNSVSQ